MKSIISLIFCVTLTSCLHTLDGGNQSSFNADAVPEITQQDFKGADAAINVISGIEIKWTQPAKAAKSMNVYRVVGKRLSLIASLPSNLTSFIDGDVNWGTIYSYQVKAVDKNGLEDLNTNVVSSLSWSGLSRVEALSRTSLRFSFDFQSPVIDEIRIYSQAKGSTQKILIATVPGSEKEVLVENLRPGYEYSLSAQAYVQALAKEDGNKIEFKVATQTVGYHANQGTPPSWRNLLGVRAFGASPGSPLHPTILDKSPQTNMVEITYLPFADVDNNKVDYVIVRTEVSQTVNTSTQKNCSVAVNESCQVCKIKGTDVTSSLSCKDKQVAPSPKKYRYTVALVHKDTVTNEEWTEPLSKDLYDSFSNVVAIPPANMVLLQREAVNYEMCIQIGKTSDPTRHNRCPYKGIGAVPFNSGIGKAALNLDKNYYDFGYNLFVDRYEMACNWTPASAGGMCGSQTSPQTKIRQNCYGTNEPTDAMGDTGNVYLQFKERGVHDIGVICWVKTMDKDKPSNAAWRTSYELRVQSNMPQSEALRRAYTSDPASSGGKKPKGHYLFDQLTAQTTCQSQIDPVYGSKRIPRLREYRAYTPLAILTNEPYAIGALEATQMVHASEDRRNLNDNKLGCPMNFNVINNPPGDFPADIDELMTDSKFERAQYKPSGRNVLGPFDYFIGSKTTLDCQSRYGMQDVASRQHTVTSDAFFLDASKRILIGQYSPVDSGNRDLAFDINGTETGFKLPIERPEGIDTLSPHNTRYTDLTYSSVPYIAMPLGLPVYVDSSASGDYRNARSFQHNSWANPVTYNYSPIDLMYEGVSRLNMVAPRFRWATNSLWSVADRPWETSARCVLPAE